MESDIQRSILLNLGMYPQIKCFRMNNGGVYDAKRACYRKPGTWHPKGLPDIMVFSNKGIMFLEVKDKGTQSIDQIEFQQLCERFGVRYAVVHSPAEARESLTFWGIIGGEML